MRITQRCLLNQKHRRNTRRFKRLPLRWHSCGSTPNNRKRTTRRLKPSMQYIKRFLQSTKYYKEINLFEHRLDARRPIRYRPLRC